MRILWINPIGYDGFNQETLAILEQARSDGTQVDLVSLPPDRPQHLQYHSYEGLVVADIVRLTYQASRRYEGIVIGCFYDLGLREAREVSGSAIVTAPCESSTAIAAQLGNTFSVLVSSRKNIPKMRENIRLYGHEHRLASLRSIGVDVLQLQADRDYTCEQMLVQGRRAIEEDGAEVLILGCAAVYGFYAEMQDKLGVPVIDAVLAPFKYAEFLANLAQSYGWRPSRVLGSEPPPEGEVSGWGIFDRPLGGRWSASDQSPG
jgi:allantoin racemase